MLTPSFRSLVGFGPKSRYLGEAAKTQEISNLKNTVGSLKRLLGRTISDPEIAEVESKYTHVKLVDANGTVGAQVCVSFIQWRVHVEKLPSNVSRPYTTKSSIIPHRTCDYSSAHVIYRDLRYRF